MTTPTPSIQSTLASYYSATFTSSYFQTIGNYIDQICTINSEILGKNVITFWDYVSELATDNICQAVSTDMEKLYNTVNLNDKKALEEGYAVILNKYTSTYLIEETKPFVVIACEAFGIDPSLIIYPVN
jgi:hypothetical protein